MELFKKLSLNILVPVIFIISAAVLGYQWEWASTLGSHSAQLDALKDGQNALKDGQKKQTEDVKTAISDLVSHIDTRFLETNAKIEKLLTSQDAIESNPAEILARMDLIKSEDKFSSAVVDGKIWLFPGNDDLKSALEKQGLVATAISPSITGYPVIDVKVIKN